MKKPKTKSLSEKTIMGFISDIVQVLHIANCNNYIGHNTFRIGSKLLCS